MDKSKAFEDIDRPRRRLFGVAAGALAVAQLGAFGLSKARADETEPTQPLAIGAAKATSFGALKQIDAGLLNIGYAEAGPPQGPAVLLLHGWPYDIYS